MASSSTGPLSDRQERENNTVVGDWVLGSLIGKWPGGDVWFASKHSNSNRHAAVKIEPRGEKNSHKPSVLSHEYDVYRSLGATDKKIPGFHTVLSFEKYQHKHVLVLDYLQWSLDYLIVRFDDLSHKTVMMIGIQALTTLANLHEKEWVHGDVSPENIFFGADSPTLHLSNFETSSRFRSKALGIHVPLEREPGRRGSLHYKSRHAHSNWVSSRRDDLESLGYVIVYAYRGKLPWSELGKGEDEKVLKLKNETSLRKLCKGMSKNMQMYFKYVMSLGFTDKPDYEHLTEIFRHAMRSSGNVEDFRYEWTA